MKILVAASLIALSVSFGASLVFAADQPAPAPAAPAPAAPAPAPAPQGSASAEDWFPGFIQACKQQGLTDADCQKQYDERKQVVLGICAKQNLNSEDACRKWVAQKREEAMVPRRVFCKQNNIAGGDQECMKFIQQKQAEAITKFKAQCQKDGLTEEQCKARFAQAIQQAQADHQFIEDCRSKGGSEEDCSAQLQKMRGVAAGGGNPPGASPPGNSPPGNAPAAKPDKGSALPPPQ